MSDGSRNLDFPVNDSISQAVCVELDKNNVTYEASVSQDSQTIYIYAPLNDVARLNYVMKKTGVAFQINDYRACDWSVGHTLCYFRYTQLNSFQKILLQDAKAQRATVMPLTKYFELSFGLIEVDLLGPEQLLEIDAKPPELTGKRWVFRAGVERLLALIAFLFLMPFGFFIALLIRSICNLIG